MSDPDSPVLLALYRRDPQEASRLADASAGLSIWEAAALGRDPEVGALLRMDPSRANACSPDGHTPLGLASYFARASTVHVLLDHGADVHAAARNAMRVQPLHAAIAAGHAEIASLLLDHGADVNARQQAGYTPLMGAAAAGRRDLVDLLLAHGADVTAVSDEGKTASSVAHERGHRDLAAHLEQAAS